MRAGYSFRPRPLPWALAMLACAAGVALGQWQTRRADEKKRLGAQQEQALRAPAVDISAAQDARGLLGMRVVARGAFDAGRTVLLDNKILHGRVGYQVLT